jgi:hypothetical protein
VAAPRGVAHRARSTVSRRTLLLFACAILLATAGAAWVGAERFLRAHPGADVFDLHFGFGPLVESLVHRGVYEVWDMGIKLHAHRLPLVPCLLAALASINTSIHFIYLAKNLLLAAVILAVLPALGRITGGSSLRMLLCLLAAFAIPYNANKFAAVEIEEGYLGQFFFAWFVLLADALRHERTSSAWGMAGLLAASVMTKASLLACTVTAGILAIVQFKRPLLRWAPLVGVLVALLGWGLFTWSISGRPALLHHMSSWNGWAGYKGNNPYTIEYYPEIDLDMLDQEGKLLPEEPGTDEWQRHDRYLDRTWKFISGNPGTFCRLMVRKAVVLFLDVRPNQHHTANVARHGESDLAWLQVVSMVMNRILILGALGHGLWSLTRGRHQRHPLALTLLLFTATYAAPYVIGFAYYRHAVPLVPVAAVYLVAAKRASVTAL